MIKQIAFPITLVLFYNHQKTIWWKFYIERVFSKILRFPYFVSVGATLKKITVRTGTFSTGGSSITGCLKQLNCLV